MGIFNMSLKRERERERKGRCLGEKTTPTHSRHLNKYYTLTFSQIFLKLSVLDFTFRYNLGDKNYFGVYINIGTFYSAAALSLAF